MLAAQTAVARSDDQPPIRMRVGGGNLLTHLPGEERAHMYQALKAIGARSARMNSYGWRTIEGVQTPADFDKAMLEAYQNGITPIILFEYEGSYQALEPPYMIGSYQSWYETGRVYAAKFRPGGEWAKANGAGDWGVSIFTAINEPDVQATIPPEDYRNALAGLADGVHSVDPTLRVVPGGFATCNSHGDPTLRGYGTAIADLFNDGRLDGLDLHTYYHERWYPMERGREFSAQACFDKVKAALGISRDINFYATEFNTARTDGWDDDALLGSLFLTAIWDELGVQRNDGSSATVIAFPWNLGDDGRDQGPIYAMATQRDPWQPEVRSKVLKMVVDLAGDMTFVSLDPRGSGLFVLEDGKDRLVVFQNRAGWTDKPASLWALDVPDWAVTAELWGWDGLRRTFDVAGKPRMEIDVPGKETYMMRFRRAKAG